MEKRLQINENYWENEECLNNGEEVPEDSEEGEDEEENLSFILNMEKVLKD